MRSQFLWLSGIAFLTSSFSAHCADSSVMGPAGFTGLATTPTAHIQDWGTFSFTYDNQLPGIAGRPDGHNFVAGFGLLPNLEIAGRIATNEVNSNCYIACGARDLSGSAKFGIGLDAAGRFKVAAGVTDVGGKVSYFTSYYGVATYSEKNYDLSLGVAKRKENGIAVGTGVVGSKSPLHGIFGSAIYRPYSWLQSDIEYTDKNAWAGVKVFAPVEWLPRGWRAYVGANIRLTQNSYTEKSWFNAGLSIPLYSVPSLPASGNREAAFVRSANLLTLPVYEALVPPRSENLIQGETTGKEKNEKAASLSKFVSVERPDESSIRKLANSLQTKGFEDISIGNANDGSVVVRVNNATYNWNSIDALGVALGVIASELGSYNVGYRFTLTQRQVPLVAVTGQTNCLRAWILNEGGTCTAGQLYTPGRQVLEGLSDGVAWLIENQAPSWKTLRVGLAPVINYAVATEYGVFDYSLGARVAFTQPLWSGAAVELRRIVPLANSDDYKENRVYGGGRLKNTTDRFIASQVLRVPLERWLPLSDTTISKWGASAVFVQGNVGRINQNYDGVHGEIRWEPGEGRHRFGVEAGRFRNANFESIKYGPTDGKEPNYANPFIASYRYAYTPTRTYFEASGGQFMYNDRGFQVGISQWFGDVAIGVYYRRTKFEFDKDSRQFVGLQLSIPIGPRKDMNPTSHVQVTGNQRFGYGVETLVRADSLNFITLGHGVLPGVPTLNDVYNSDRSGLVYFEDNVRRIRDAARD